MRFRVQFGINLQEWVFQKAEIARAASARKIRTEKVPEDAEAIFFAFEQTFSRFPYKIFVTALHDIFGPKIFFVFLPMIIQIYDV